MQHTKPRYQIYFMRSMPGYCNSQQYSINVRDLRYTRLQKPPRRRTIRLVRRSIR